MSHTQICFQCPKCLSFNTVLRGMRVSAIDSHPGFHNLDVDFDCKDCGTLFSQQFAAPSPHDFQKEVSETVKGSYDLEKIRLSLKFDKPYHGDTLPRNDIYR